MATSSPGTAQALRDRLPATWPALALAASVAMLATAHAFERFGGYAPCLLCLKQREVYWVAGGLALAGLLVLRLAPGRRLRPWLALGLGGIFLFGRPRRLSRRGGMEVVAGPRGLRRRGGSVSDLDMSGLLDGTLKVKPPACDEAAWRLLGLSMAGWNVLVSLGLAFLGFLAWRMDRRSP